MLPEQWHKWGMTMNSGTNEATQINALLSQSNLATAAEAAEQRRRAQETRELLRMRSKNTLSDGISLAAAKEAMKAPESPFGNGIEGKMLAIALNDSIPPDHPTKIAAMEYLERDRTTTTPEGTTVTPGYSFENGKIVRSTGTTVDKPLSETERRGTYTVGMMRNFHADGGGYIPGSFESLASDIIPASFSGLLTTPEFKKYKRNADEWARSATLLKSGVTARPDGVEASFINYWPQPGDGPNEVREKREARERSMSEAEAAYTRRTGSKSASGRSIDEILDQYAPR